MTVVGIQLPDDRWPLEEGTMKTLKMLLPLAALAWLAGCSGLADFADRQAAYNRQMGMSNMNQLGGMNGTNDMPDPFPHSESQDQQRALYQQNQDYQRALQAGQDRESQKAGVEGSMEPDLTGMHCDETSTLTGSGNSVSGTTTRNCR